MSRLAWASDLHWDHAKGTAAKDAFLEDLDSVKPDAVLLTGDIADAVMFPKAVAEIHLATNKPVYYVLGNHDYYGSHVRLVREKIRALKLEGCTYLTQSEAVDLGDFHLIGVDGWGDMRNGNPAATRVVLADYHYIDDLKYKTHQEIIERLNHLGNQDAAILAGQLKQEWRHDTVVVGTHVPPYPGAAWHLGKTSDANWQPNFTCRAVGDILDTAASIRQRTQFVVFCGHSHSFGLYPRRPNLQVYTAEARYGYPQVQGVYTRQGFERFKAVT